MQRIVKPLIQKNDTKIVLVVLDGLGGLPVNGKTELETAATPNMDALARESACGLHTPVAPGITPGSGPGHLGLFGYDPLECQIGRGILEALGLGLEVRKTDVAIRCNYATIRDGLIVDRRAGRIPTEQSRRLTERLQREIPSIDGVEVTFAPGMEHRCAVLLRFPQPLEPDAALIPDTDPQKEGKAPLAPVPQSKSAEKVAQVAEKLISRAHEVLKNEEKANFILTRGFSGMPDIPTFEEAFGLRSLAIATYPMYRGLAKLVGMNAPALEGSVEDEIDYLKQQYSNYDFFFLHVKKVDSYGEDGNFNGKVARIEEFDALLPRILAMNPDVLMITGDHSTPAVMKGHSWHPVPVLLRSFYVLGGLCSSFSERECTRGELGIFPTVNLMPLALANSLRLKKFGA
ncbi:MAG: 2,3-bisphosphoglycerate-independent phosphoglycerate mutase [Alphaproteobacteria bacterium]|uniref:Probable 2,3-bisphosphoglycerate-independent phosphoglycerate mutase n=1 Tax=Candidatus Nitrobium versatile TaxID=2884831 RepID=A0A953JEC1_9BACT|nr:2,3-bisphosphoglycerate-independent phosphoglycerate mutase [Candidatus Nitrobium versatile]